MIDTRRRTINSDPVKHILSSKKKIEALGKSIVKRFFFKRNSKTNT